MPDQASTSPGKDGVRSYAIRRVNPFLGVLQVIESDVGRALSSNGVAWEIEIRAERQTGWGSLNENTRQSAWYRFGMWSEADGLVTLPLAPQLDRELFSRHCNTLIGCIRERLAELPFRLKDRQELWLFDQQDRQPLALLATAIPGSTLPAPEPRYWRSSLGANGVPGQRRYPAASELEAQVRQRAGFNVNKHWVTRQDDGSGIIEASKIQLHASAFPPFLLGEDWPEAAQAELASAYIEWIAPSLLTLQQLDRRQRECMENKLYLQAASVEHHWHLYPEILDENRLSAARVQCHLQKVDDGRSNSQ
jgi:hypothetical protein